ncbi:MAG TPA: phosphatase PAP2 family protein [Clostridia bacterium]|nr:phosphatase PAP2 family protein [Clostridia bacterium]
MACAPQPRILHLDAAMRGGAWGEISRYVATIVSSVSFLVVVALLLGWQTAYLAAGVLILYLGKHGKLGIWLVVATQLSSRAVNFTPRLLPITYDSVFWQIDRAIGFSPTAAMDLVAFSPNLRTVVFSTYFGFPVAIALASVISANANRFCSKLAVASALGYLLYFVFPACGPFYFLTSTVNAPRNAMPSLHTTWALMIWYELRLQSLPVRLGSDLFLLFTVIATLGFGEHYFIDLLVAVPFVAIIESVMSDPLSKRNLQERYRLTARAQSQY